MMLLHKRRDHIDTEALRELVVSMDLLKPWQTFGCLLVDLMGLPAEEFPLYDPKYSGLVAKVARRILDEEYLQEQGRELRHQQGPLVLQPFCKGLRAVFDIPEACIPSAVAYFG